MKQTLCAFTAYCILQVLGFMGHPASQQLMAQKKNIPFVYDVENTGAQLVKQSTFTPLDQLKEETTLPNPFQWSNGKGEVKNFKQWAKRRAEIAFEIQHYEIGLKPTVAMEDIDARMSDDTLIVDVHVHGQTLTLRSKIFYPTGGTAPYPLMIGASMNALPNKFFTERNIAMATFSERQW